MTHTELGRISVEPHMAASHHFRVYGESGLGVCRADEGQQEFARELEHRYNVYPGLLEALKFAQKAIAKPSRIRGQNDAYCDGYELIEAAIAAAEGGE